MTTSYADASSDAASSNDGRGMVNSMAIDFCLSLTSFVCSSPTLSRRRPSAWQRWRSNSQTLGRIPACKHLRRRRSNSPE